MTHVNQYTGISYAEDPTIIGYETGNELGGTTFGDKNVSVEWTREICQLIKKLGSSPDPSPLRHLPLHIKLGKKSKS